MLQQGPNERYNSNNVPHGGIFVAIYRPTDPINTATNPTLLGKYRLESCSPKEESKTTERPDIDEGPNGFYITGGNIKGNVVIQRGATQATLQAGDWFDATLRYDPPNATGVAERFVIESPDRPADAGYRKMSCSVIVDLNPPTAPTPVNPLNGN